MAYVLQRKQVSHLKVLPIINECIELKSIRTEVCENVLQIGTVLGRAAKNLKEHIILRSVGDASSERYNMMALCA